MKKISLALFVFSLVACSSTKVVTQDLRTDIENSGMNLDNSTLRYYIDRDVELKASKKVITMNEQGEGVKATVEKMRNYVLIEKGTAGICKETGEHWIRVAFEPDFPEATLIFVRNKNGIYRIDWRDEGLIEYDGSIFQIQSKPTRTGFNSFFGNGGSLNGREAELEIKYDVKEKEDVKTRKAKGFN